MTQDRSYTLESHPTVTEADGHVLVIRGQAVVLDHVVAAAFGVETRALNQAVARNPEKFPESHCFRLTDDERIGLTSLNVISRPTHGGRRSAPLAFTQKGAVRVATVLRSPRALKATDEMIDLFIHVQAQVAAGRTEITVPGPTRAALDPTVARRFDQLRGRLVEAVETLLDTVVDPVSRTTVRQQISAIGTEAIEALNAHLRARSLENEKIAADTLLLLEKVSEVRHRTAAEVARTEAETERIRLDNLDRKIDIVQRLLAMTQAMEPNALVRIFGPTGQELRAATGEPPPAEPLSPRPS